MPKVYGIEHIIYLLITIIVMTITLYMSKNYFKTEKSKTIFVKSIAGLLLIFIIWNRIAIAYYADNYLLLLPDSFCGTTSLVLALSVLIGKKNNDFLHCVVYFGIVGGLITTFYPDFIGQRESIFFSKTISGLLHHTFMLFLIIACIQTKYFIPTIKKWKALLCGSAFYMCYGLFLIKVLNFNDAMTINSPLLEGTIFYWYTVGAIFLVVYFVSMGIYELIKKKISNKKEIIKDTGK